MKIQLFAGAALALAFAAPAFAQPASDTDWTGPYVGVDLGATFSHDHLDESTRVFVPPQTGTSNLSAVEPTGGGLVGYNWEFPQHIVRKVHAPVGQYIDFARTQRSNRPRAAQRFDLRALLAHVVHR